MCLFPHVYYDRRLIKMTSYPLAMKSARSLPTDGLHRTKPAEAGVAAAGILDFTRAAASQGLELHTLLVARHGKLAAELYRWPYNATRPRIGHSLAKSFTSAAIGLAISEGYFKLTDRVVDFFPDHLPSVVSDNLRAMTVKDLLTMRTGHAEETSGSRWRAIKTSWIAEFLKIPVVHRPGDVYVYTSAASYMLAAIFTKAVGLTLHEYLRPRLFEPLGITGETWDIGPDGINPGGNGLSCKVTDLLKFGMLHLQKGMWRGVPILPAEWIAEATHPIGDSPYGYHWVTGPQGEYFAMGLFGQLIAVLPAYDAVVVLTSAIASPVACSGIWVPLLLKHLDSIFPNKIAEDGTEPQLEACIAELAQPPVLSSAKPQPTPRGTQFYAVENNELDIDQISFLFEEDRCTVRMWYPEGERSILVGIDRWLEGETDIPGAQLHHGYEATPARVVAGACWRSENLFVMTWIFAEMTFRDTVECEFQNDRLTFGRSVNVNSGAMSLPILHGTRIQP
jgi:CubicO group peptidase (beta-lactamase class C family)